MTPVQRPIKSFLGACFTEKSPAFLLKQGEYKMEKLRDVHPVILPSNILVDIYKDVVCCSTYLPDPDDPEEGESNVIYFKLEDILPLLDYLHSAIPLSQARRVK